MTRLAAAKLQSPRARVHTQITDWRTNFDQQRYPDGLILHILRIFLNILQKKHAYTMEVWDFPYF